MHGGGRIVPRVHRTDWLKKIRRFERLQILNRVLSCWSMLHAVGKHGSHRQLASLFVWNECDDSLLTISMTLRGSLGFQGAKCQAGKAMALSDFNYS